MSKVLSIDWDYFLDATAQDRLFLLPDGGNEKLPKGVRNVIWGNLYSNPKLKNVGILNKEVAALKEFLKKFKGKMLIADSHQHIYEFVEDIKGEDLTIYNIDFHHDMFDNDKEQSNVLDCGNWARILNEENSVKIKWVSRKDSQIEINNKGEKPNFKSATFKEALSQKYDRVFICKSEMWSPPHLDIFFKLAFYESACKNSALVEKDVFEPRKINVIDYSKMKFETNE